MQVSFQVSISPPLPLSYPCTTQHINILSLSSLHLLDRHVQHIQHTTTLPQHLASNFCHLQNPYPSSQEPCLYHLPQPHPQTHGHSCRMFPYGLVSGGLSCPVEEQETLFNSFLFLTSQSYKTRKDFYPWRCFLR